MALLMLLLLLLALFIMKTIILGKHHLEVVSLLELLILRIEAIVDVVSLVEEVDHARSLGMTVLVASVIVVWGHGCVVLVCVLLDVSLLLSA